jgi:DNA modification methylase
VDDKAQNGNLPEQNSFFKIDKLKRSVRAGTQLPDPKIEPYGYDPNAKFRHIFPELNLPPLLSNLPDDHVTFGHPELPDTTLYFGDNLYVLRNMPSESVDLIYIDPPFFSKRDYVQIWGDDNEIRSFQDIFEDGMFSYLTWLNARLWEMKRVLKNTGSIYVHCDWHASHYIKAEMDKIFGYSNFRNEIIWYYPSGGGRTKVTFNRKHDSLLWYSKTDNYKYLIDNIRVSYKETSMYSKYGTVHHGTGKEYKPDVSSGKNPDDTWEMNILNPTAHERIGYPTQKPLEVVQRIIDAHSEPGDVVADFFMGGGTFGAAALGQRTEIGAPLSGTKYYYDKPRTFIGCDISRVATSVTFNRLTEVCEQMSGITASEKSGQQQLGAELAKVPDIRTAYVGSYPINKFDGIEQKAFTNFVIGLYGASTYTGEGDEIDGLVNGKVVISVGPASPSERVQVMKVRRVLEQVLRQYSKQLAAGEEKIIQIIGWSFEPLVDRWKGDATNTLNKQGLKVTIELISLSSEAFRQKIFREIGESNTDLKFNRLNQLLSFTSTPTAGHITITKQRGLECEFALVGAQAIGAGGRLINAQWDFDYKDKRFSDKAHALNRAGKAGTYEAVLSVTHKFEKPGKYVIAARVQDNLDGEAVTVAELSISNSSHELQLS